MKEITLKAYAKINLSLDVLGKLANGYHEVLMVMEQIDLYDHVKVSVDLDHDDKSGEDPQKGYRVELSTNIKSLPTDENNIAYRAASLIMEKYKKDGIGLIKIEIEKRIPVAAGLAGGSADGAAVLHGLNKLLDLNLDVGALMELGVKLGADIPFCIAGQAALNDNLDLQKDPYSGTCAVASGIGEKLEIVDSLDAWILLSKPPIEVSTAKVYEGLKLSEVKEHPDTLEMVAGLRENNYFKISRNMINVLENYSLAEYPIIMYTKNKILKEGKPCGVLMSGSGPTVFAVYTNKRRGKVAYDKLKSLNPETFLIKTL